MMTLQILTTKVVEIANSKAHEKANNEIKMYFYIAGETVNVITFQGNVGNLSKRLKSGIENWHQLTLSKKYLVT